MSSHAVTTSELAKLVLARSVDSVTAVQSGAGYWVLARGDNGARFVLFTAQRKEKREFKSLDAVAKVASNVGLRHFEVQV